jgi:hypothetical protein
MVFRIYLCTIVDHMTGKGDASEIKVLSSCPLGSKIKPCLGRGASESLNSTSTWIRGERQIADTTG